MLKCHTGLAAVLVSLALTGVVNAAVPASGKGGTLALYEAAVASIEAGDMVRAAARMVEAIEAGYANYFSLMYDPDLGELRKAPEWRRVVETFEARHPWAQAFRLLADNGTPSWLRYANAKAALAAGAHPPDEFAPTFRQYYATQAAFVGDYVEADHYYRRPAADHPDPTGTGFVEAHPAMGAILASAEKSRAVFLNESHAQSVTRAMNVSMVRALRSAGYTHLALEALAGKRIEGECATLALADEELAKRGYVGPSSGYYLEDPIYAELVRVALAEGLVLVAYDDIEDSPPLDMREQRQAQNLACVVNSDPKARLIAIGGFGHISERETHPSIPGGMMGHRFRQQTGIDPVTVDTTVLLPVDQAAVTFPSGAGDVYPAVLRNAGGETFRVTGYDHVVLVPVVSARGPDGNWLTLGGHRTAVDDALACPGSAGLCLIEARSVSALQDAAASDRCVPKAPERSCRLYLAPGSYRVSARDEENRQTAEAILEVAS